MTREIRKTRPKKQHTPDAKARFIVRAFLAGLSMETCDYIFDCLIGTSEKIVREWAKNADRSPDHGR